MSKSPIFCRIHFTQQLNIAEWTFMRRKWIGGISWRNEFWNYNSQLFKRTKNIKKFLNKEILFEIRIYIHNINFFLIHWIDIFSSLYFIISIHQFFFFYIMLQTFNQVIFILYYVIDFKYNQLIHLIFFLWIISSIHHNESKYI